jgi:hypothetical protein
MIPRILGLSLSLCASLFVVACGSQKDLAAADVGVTRFHQQLDSEDYAAI